MRDLTQIIEIKLHDYYFPLRYSVLVYTNFPQKRLDLIVKVVKRSLNSNFQPNKVLINP